jgi:hypothetical protein
MHVACLYNMTRSPVEDILQESAIHPGLWDQYLFLASSNSFLYTIIRKLRIKHISLVIVRHEAATRICMVVWNRL